ncbi:MAG: cytochrome c3 family protein [Planctomycetes bacterium]|nr:cytochrome c3 family protein [Planctomycetota bacterium]
MTRGKGVLPLVILSALGLACNGKTKGDPGPGPGEVLEEAGDLTIREFDQADVIYFENADVLGGSTVVFPHRKHSTVNEVDCYFCHHQDLEGDRPRGCRTCHFPDRVVDRAPTAEKAFHDRCRGCHLETNRADPTRNVALECEECHIPDRTRQTGVGGE